MKATQVHSHDPRSPKDGRVSVVVREPVDADLAEEARRASEIQTARLADEARVIAALVLAFSADPANRWMYPSPESYLGHFPEFVRALGGRSFDCGTSYFIGDVQAAALWLPPGIGPDEEALMDLVGRSLAGQQQDALVAMVEQMGRYHPDEPHWYLPWMGVDPAQQRKGYGSALLSHTLRACPGRDACLP